MLSYPKEKVKQFLIENYQKLGAQQCASILNYKVKSIWNWASLLDLSKKPKLSKSQEQWLKSHYTSLGYTKCRNILGLSKGQMSHYQKKFRLKTKRKYDFSTTVHNLINPNSPYAAYILGIIWGDGHVSRKKCVTVLAMAASDITDIEWVFDSVGVWAKNNHTPKIKKWKQKTILSIYDKQLAQFLTDNDYYAKSFVSPNKILKIIPEKFHNYFWRGLFDADGNISYRHNASKISSTYEQDWAALVQLCNFLKISHFKIRRHVNHKNHKSSEFYIGRYHETITFLNYIYKGKNVDKIGLQRKHQQYKTLQNKKIRHNLRWHPVKLKSPV